MKLVKSAESAIDGKLEKKVFRFFVDRFRAEEGLNDEKWKGGGHKMCSSFRDDTAPLIDYISDRT